MSSTSFSLLGVRFSYFSLFIEECGGKDKLQDLTTTDICVNFLKSKTLDSKLSLCDQLHNEERTDVVGTSI